MVEVHELETKIKQLKLEKDQMVSVLSEKSREESNLKTEVHRLMGIISAEKSALAKLQQDNNALISQKVASLSGSTYCNGEVRVVLFVVVRLPRLVEGKLMLRIS